MKEVFILRDLECIKAVAHPRRIDILNTFKESPLSAKQLSEILDEPHAKINYHIKTLYKVGVLELVEEKIKSGIVEKYYYPKAKNIILDKNAINLYLHSQNRDVLINKFEELINKFYNTIEEDCDQKETVMYNEMLLTKQEVDLLNETIEKTIEEIISSRNGTDVDAKYSTSIISLPKIMKEETSQ